MACSEVTLRAKIHMFDPVAHQLKWFVRALGRFSNFRTTESYFTDFTKRLMSILLRMRSYLRTALKPPFAHAEVFDKVIDDE